MLQLDPAARQTLWTRVIEIIEQYAQQVGSARVAPKLDPTAIRALLSPFDFNSPRDPIAAVDFAATQLWEHQVHTPHPRYFGLFNPAPTTMGIAGDVLVAAFNPQIAAWSHSPFAAETERHLVRAFGTRFGYVPDEIDGAFTSGGAEANHTALECAIAAAFPDFGSKGVRALPRQPVFYASAEAHHSFAKAARLSGIGRESLREIPVDEQLRMRPDLLAAQIDRDLADGFAPFLIVATVGTTNAAAVDPVLGLAAIAKRHSLWLHVDAAWGGAAALSSRFAHLLDGCAQSDSITFDAHKWLSSPMGAGVFITRHRDIMDRAFATATAYMPKDAAGLDVIDPHLHTMQWSRRFIGLKVFLALAVSGWDGFAQTIEHMADMGDLLRTLLTQRGWRILNSTPLPVICFDRDWRETPQETVNRVVASGKAWISTVRLGGVRTAIRACITNYLTGPADVEALVDSLEA